MNPEFQEVDDKATSKLDQRIADLEAKLGSTQDQLFETVEANTVLTTEFNSTMKRADTALQEARTGNLGDYAIILAGLALGGLTGYYTQKLMNRIPLMGVIGACVFGAGIGMTRWHWRYRGAAITGGLAMGVAGTYVFIMEKLPPYATR